MNYPRQSDSIVIGGIPKRQCRQITSNAHSCRRSTIAETAISKCNVVFRVKKM